MTLVHICPVADWEAAQGPHYTAAGYDADGFIHLSRADQVTRPAQRFYAGRTDLLLLVIDEQRVPEEIRWEPSTEPADDGELFPHLYGPLPVEAVSDVVPFPPSPDGRFELPAQVR